MAARLASFVVGRDEELEVLETELSRAGPAAVLVEGEPGIGKTTIWRAAIEGAGGERVVLTCRGSPAETRLSYAAVGDLLESLGEEAFTTLPDPQRHALAAALLREEIEAGDHDVRAVALGFRNALRIASERARCLVAVDDLQWLDPASVAVLDYALRRLRSEPVLVLATARSRSDLPLDLERILPSRRLEIGPLSLGALHHVLRTQLGAPLQRQTLRSIHEITGGNPFYALELARARGNDDELQSLLPQSLDKLVRDRLEVVPQRTRRVLFDVAALAQPITKLVDVDALEPAVEADLLTFRGSQICFTHPLLAAGAYSMLSLPQRRKAHRRLADLVETQEERARHLALATDGADENVAGELTVAAEEAIQRGAPAAAGELLDAAIRVTPAASVDVLAHRMLAAADAHLAAGEWEKARSLLREVRDRADADSAAEAVARLGTWVLEDVSQGASLCEAVLEQVTDAGLRSRLFAARCANLHLLGDFRRATQSAQSAVAEAERAEDKQALAVALGWLGMFGVITAAGDASKHLERARDLAESRRHLLPVHPGTWLGLRHMYRHELRTARAYLEAEHAAAREADDDVQRSSILLHLCELEWRSGEWPIALQYAEEGYDLAEQVGDTQGCGALLYARALVLGHLGRVEESRAATAEGLRLCSGIQDRLFPAMHAIAAGTRDLSLGAYDDALAAFAKLDTIFEEQALDPGIALYQGDAIEALIAVGRLAEASQRAGGLAGRAEELDRPFLRAEALRGRALVHAAEGDLPGATVALEQSLEQLSGLEAPFAQARGLLALGIVSRRGKKRAVARDALGEARILFERLGAEVWLRRTREEEARVSGRAPSGDTLTATERRVAELVAGGLSNKEVAAALFVTVRTVEANLTRIYSKLSVRSRTELARLLSS